MNTTKNTATVWVCTDCLMLLANGETPPEMGEDETAAWLAAIERNLDGCHITLGLMAEEHADDCPNVDHETGEWLGQHECWCEHDEFSWRSCGSCGSSLGGSRDAAAIWFD